MQNTKKNSFNLCDVCTKYEMVVWSETVEDLSSPKLSQNFENSLSLSENFLPKFYPPPKFLKNFLPKFVSSIKAKVLGYL